MVHDSWLQIASTAEKLLALVRASRNTPATDWTSTAPPTSANGEPPTGICTLDPENWPATTGSIAAGLLGDVGDPPPQAGSSVASVTPDATWQAPAQNRRRETGVFVSDIVR